MPHNEQDNEFKRTYDKPEQKTRKMPTMFLVIGTLNLLLFIIVVLVISDLLASNESNRVNLERLDHQSGAADQGNRQQSLLTTRWLKSHDVEIENRKKEHDSLRNDLH